MRVRNLFPVMLLAAVLSGIHVSCGSRTEKQDQEQVHLPESSGLPYELALVIPRGLYAGELRDSLDAVLLGSTPLLSQHEAMFRLDVVYTDMNQNPWRTFRNRLRVEVNPAERQARIGVARDVTAHPQVEVLLTGPTAHDLAQFLGERKEQLTDIFVESELRWEASNLRRKHSQATIDALEAFGHRVCVPPALRATKVGKDFLWTGTNLNDRDQNFIFYSRPWDGRPLSEESFVEAHDSVLHANVPGSRPDQWMQTTRVDGRPLILSRLRAIDGKTVLQVHGLWEMRHGALGGSFVALERVDTAARQVLVAEGFIYSPHSPKRDILRQMEAALRTFE